MIQFLPESDYFFHHFISGFENRIFLPEVSVTMVSGVMSMCSIKSEFRINGM